MNKARGRVPQSGTKPEQRTVPPAGLRAIRLLPSESFFSVFILGINPTPCGKRQKAATLSISWICVAIF
jgi:hypothetical protein